MLNPDLRSILKDKLSRYSLVIAASKRARTIAEDAEKNDVIITEKTVSLAVEELLKGKYVIIEPEEIRGL